MRLRHTHELSGGERQTLHEFLAVAFDGDFSSADFDHCLGGVHVFAEDDSGIVGHASVVQRHLTVADTVLRTGYVEAVAVASHRRRRGVGDAVMARIEDVIVHAYDLGALGASESGRSLYLRRGWEQWLGPLGVLTTEGVTPTRDDEGSTFVLRTSNHPDLDLTDRLLCEQRAGSSW